VTLDIARARYADAIAATSKLRSTALRDAFARVPREAFLGPGPWSLARIERDRTYYERTPDADPTHVYQDVPIAIDEVRQLNNGQPSFLASCLDALDLVHGDRFVHIGCGTGYYTAIAACVVGTAGHALAVEIDPALAARARANLASMPQVSVANADGNALEATFADAVFVNAGVTTITRPWVDSLVIGGRLLVPLTTQWLFAPGREIGVGKLLKITRRDTGFDARFVSSVGIFHCSGARDATSEARLRTALARGDAERVSTLRTDPHDSEPDCWLHDARCCLSMHAARGIGRD
jgi:protein-L-isoaspartate(D-aspartate) O-methyltransferase